LLSKTNIELTFELFYLISKCKSIFVNVRIWRKKIEKNMEKGQNIDRVNFRKISQDIPQNYLIILSYIKNNKIILYLIWNILNLIFFS